MLIGRGSLLLRKEGGGKKRQVLSGSHISHCGPDTGATDGGSFWNIPGRSGNRCIHLEGHSACA